MESILVAIDARHGAWEALSHAFSLARRIALQLNILRVKPSAHRALSIGETGLEAAIQERLELQIEVAKAEGIRINYFVTEGSYEDEVIDFVRNNRITLLVCEVCEGDVRGMERELASLRSIRHRVTCRVETVFPKKQYM